MFLFRFFCLTMHTHMYGTHRHVSIILKIDKKKIELVVKRCVECIYTIWNQRQITFDWSLMFSYAPQKRTKNKKKINRKKKIEEYQRQQQLGENDRNDSDVDFFLLRHSSLSFSRHFHFALPMSIVKFLSFDFTSILFFVFHFPLFLISSL